MSRLKDYLSRLVHGDDDSSVAAPAAGAVALGGTYGSLRYLNNSLSRNGWAESNGYNKNTLKELNSYLKLKPTGKDFGVDYVDRTYKALSSPLFKDNPQAVYEIIQGGSPETRAIQGTLRDIKKSFVGKIINKLSRGRFGRRLDAIRSGFNGSNHAARMLKLRDPSVSLAELTHMPAMGTSFQDAYLRALSETNLSSVGRRGVKGMGLEKTVGGRARMLAEALLGKKPEGMSSLDYFNQLMANDKAIGVTGQPNKFLSLRNAYSKALDQAKAIIGDAKTVEDATSRLINAMGGDPGKSISSVVEGLVGRAAKWDIEKLPGGKFGNLAVKMPRKPGVMTINNAEEALSAAKSSLALQLMHGDMSRTFSTASGHHISQIRGPQILGMLRNKLLRRGAGASAVGLGGLAVYNLIKNRRNRQKSFIDRLLNRG